MSASLVGSEMCIRDRLPGRRRADDGVVALAPPAPALRRVALRPLALAAVCLLYTSDAADDM
eukprot:10916611-Alexandrium_andersonii.AAC.1